MPRSRSLVFACLCSLFAVVMIAAALAGCHANSPSIDPRALARGAVSTLEDAWIVAAQSCVESSDTTVVSACKVGLLPARQALLAAASAVDGWTDADQKNFPCLMADAEAGLKETVQVLGAFGVQLPQVVSDAFALAGAFTPQCVRDAGASDGGVE